MALLTREERRQLIAALLEIPRLSTSSGRNTLLQDLPRALSMQLDRSNDRALDLEIIVNTCNEWEPDPRMGSAHPLQLIIDAAHYWARGSKSGTRLEELLAIANRRLKEITSPPSRPPCPYPGMAPFRPDEARFFKGRRREIDDILLRLRQRHLLLVIGPSGSGKSSLISAGLIPTLIERQPGAWHIVLLQPGAEPTRALSRALGVDLGQLQPDDSPVSASRSEQHHLIIVDPFEEVFALAERDEQGRFIAALSALRKSASFRILLLLRADFYPELMTSALWPVDLNDRVEIAPLADDALREAIRLPAEEVHVQVEEALVERLLADAAAEPGGLPLLQETLQVLWDRMEGHVLSLRAYQDLGRQSYSGLAVALAMKADATWDSLSPKQQALARRMFLRLIQFGEGRGYSFGSTRGDIRRRQPVEDLRALGDDTTEFDATLAALTENRLLSLTWDEAGQAKMVDLTHDALIVGWPRLQEWLKERREAEQIRRRFEAHATDWDHSGRPNTLLLNTEKLREIELWLEGPYSRDLGVTETLMALVDASKQAIEVARQSNRLALRGELVQLEERAEDAEAKAFAAYAEAEREKLAARQRELHLAQALISATGKHHESLLRRSRSLALVTVAHAELDHNPELAALLAVEAILTTNRFGEPLVPQAVDELHQALLRLENCLTLRGHQAQVYSCTYSPNGKYLLTASEDHTAKLWDARTVQAPVTLRGHTGPVRSAVYSHDGRRVATASFDKTARIWDPETGAPVLILPHHRDGVNQAAFSPDGHRIATASSDGTVKICDAATGQEEFTLQGPTSIVAVSYSADGRNLLTLAENGMAQVWAAETGEQGLAIPDLSHVVTAVHNPDGTLFVARSDGLVQIWDPGAVQKSVYLSERIDRLRTATYSPDGRYIVTVGNEDTTIWDVDTGQRFVALQGYGYSVEYALYSPDGKNIATAEADQIVRIWNAQTGQELVALHGLAHWSGIVTYNKDGSWLAAVDRLGVVRQYPTEPSELLDLAAETVRRPLTAEERAFYLAEDP